MNTETAEIERFTDAQQKADRIFALDKITPKDIEDFSVKERRHLGETLTEVMRTLKGAEFDKLLNQIELIIDPVTKGEIWESNHAEIGMAVTRHMREYGIMPTKTTIAEKTGLTRQTVAKHLKEYKQHPEFGAQMEQFKFMAPNLLASVFKTALNGDMRAARLYFEMIGAVNTKNTNTVVNEQNNNIQINNTILNQENLKKLTSDQLKQIEGIIMQR